MIELLLQADRALTMGLVDQAEYLYRQTLAADPRNSIAVVGLARVALERSDDVEAWRQARRALGIDPQNVAARRMVEALEQRWAARGQPLPDGASMLAPAPRPRVAAPPTIGASPPPVAEPAALAPIAEPSHGVAPEAAPTLAGQPGMEPPDVAIVQPIDERAARVEPARWPAAPEPPRAEPPVPASFVAPPITAAPPVAATPAAAPPVAAPPHHESRPADPYAREPSHPPTEPAPQAARRAWEDVVASADAAAGVPGETTAAGPPAERSPHDLGATPWSATGAVAPPTGEPESLPAPLGEAPADQPDAIGDSTPGAAPVGDAEGAAEDDPEAWPPPDQEPSNPMLPALERVRNLFGRKRE